MQMVPKVKFRFLKKEKSTMGYFSCYKCYNHFSPIGDYSWFMDEYAVDLETGQPNETKKGYLGEPLGSYQVLASGVYRRDFDNGIVLCNPTSSTQTVDLVGSYRKIDGVQEPSINDGSVVENVTLSSEDGIILLNAL